MLVFVFVFVLVLVLVLSEQQACEHSGFQLSMSLHLSFELILSIKLSQAWAYISTPARTAGH